MILKIGSLILWTDLPRFAHLLEHGGQHANLVIVQMDIVGFAGIAFSRVRQVGILVIDYVYGQICMLVLTMAYSSSMQAMGTCMGFSEEESRLMMFSTAVSGEVFSSSWYSRMMGSKKSGQRAT